MRRLAFVIAMLVATSAFADNYSDGVAAVQSRDYSAAVQLLQRAITEAPVETPSYLPHYWIGIARFNLGDIDGALRHWRISQDQGAIAKTSERGKLADWIAKAQAEKQRRASADPDAAKKAADAAISRALAKQGEAISRGRDRSDSYRTAARKLQDANAEFRKGGYGAAQKLAEDAQALFVGTPVVVVPPPDIETAAHAEAAVALQNFRRRTLKNAAATREWERLRKELDRASNDADVERVAAAIKKADEALNAHAKPAAEAAAATQKPNLERAYRAYAGGDLDVAEQLLTKIIDATPTAEAFLLRGCARYTRALLTRGDDREAAADLAEALQRDRELKLDDSAFSPKLISFFEKVRRSR